MNGLSEAEAIQCSVACDVCQRSYGHRRQKYSARLTVLCIRYVGKPICQPHIVPGQSQRLAQPQPGVAEHDQERGKLFVELLRFLEDRERLLGPEPSCLPISSRPLWAA